MSRVNVNIGRVVADGDVSPRALEGSLKRELRTLLEAQDGALPKQSAQLQTVRVTAPEAQGSKLGRMAARAIHGGLKR